MTPPAMPTAAIPGIPALSQVQLERLFAALPNLHRVWVFGSRAMGCHQPGSDIDLCLELKIENARLAALESKLDSLLLSADSSLPIPPAPDCS
jgi:predicted nucleotidyltransferase